MSFLVLGLSHQTAPLDLLERVSVSKDQLPSALTRLGQSIGQVVLLSTCNRLELYTFEIGIEVQSQLRAFLSDVAGTSPDQLEPHLYQHVGDGCVRHLFRVATGLDSMVVGDMQILGQVQAAYHAASELGLVQGSFSKLFHQALHIGCRVHRETNFGNSFRSVSRAGAELANKVLGNLPGRRALVVGVGEAGRLATESLVDLGVTNIAVMNRTLSRAEALARKMGGVAVPLEELPEQLIHADLVVSSTGSPAYVLDRATVQEAMRRRNGKSLLLIDIAMPRSIDPAAGEVDGVELHDMDSLHLTTENSAGNMGKGIVEVEKIVEEGTDKFLDWLTSLDSVPLILAIREQAEEVRQAQVAKALRKLESKWSQNGFRWGIDELSSQLDLMTSALVKKLLHHPTIYLKGGRDPVRQQMVRELFNVAGPGGSKRDSA